MVQLSEIQRVNFSMSASYSGCFIAVTDQLPKASRAVIFNQIIMTATQEINKWVAQHRKLQSDAGREAFYQSIIASLDKKSSESLADGLLALKQSVKARRLAAEKSASNKPGGSFQVFPSSEEERELLKSLLERMNIPFKMSA